MRPDWKTCFRICASVFALYLCIFYWESLSKLLGTLIGALSPLILGLVIAYVLNILMSVYERHYFPKSRKPWVKNSRPVVCLLAAILTLIAIVSLVVNLVVPELMSCLRLLLESVEPAVEKLLDSQWIAQLLPADILQRLNAIDWGDWIQKAVKVVGAGLGSAAGAVYATIIHVANFDEAMIVSVNHSGRSCAVGSIAGALLGARLGVEALPEFYLESLEPAQALTELAIDLTQAKQTLSIFDDSWDQKYVQGMPSH